MFNDENGRQAVARSIAHYAYRNTKLEDYHAQCVIINKDFHTKIHAIVNAKLKNVKLMQRYLDDFRHDNIADRTVLDESLQTVPDNLHLRFLRYSQEIVFGIYNWGINWEKAQYIGGASIGQNLATYVLGGEFVFNCNNGSTLDDSTMCKINKDVYNRIYTLLLDGRFYN